MTTLLINFSGGTAWFEPDSGKGRRRLGDTTFEIRHIRDTFPAEFQFCIESPRGGSIRSGPPEALRDCLSSLTDDEVRELLSDYPRKIPEEGVVEGSLQTNLGQLPFLGNYTWALDLPHEGQLVVSSCRDVYYLQDYLQDLHSDCNRWEVTLKGAFSRQRRGPNLTALLDELQVYLLNTARDGKIASDYVRMMTPSEKGVPSWYERLTSEPEPDPSRHAQSVS